MASYRVEHRTRYRYETRVSTSQHLACLEPRELPFQHLRSFELIVEPAPARVIRRIDYSGNARHQFELFGLHGELNVTAHSLVDVFPREACTATLPWQDAREWLRRAPFNPDDDVVRYIGPSPQVAISPEIAEFARESFLTGRSLVEGAVDLTRRIYGEFTFDPAATTPATPVGRVLAERRGVCQDFAQFQIACLRSLGLAARYVSGYLLTDPPPGQPRLIGADASHAWLSVYVPRHGWLDLDPTNDVIVGERHVTIGWGRDYSDVTPLRGVLLGGARHQLTVAVSVVPIESAAS